jgi:hypothetical protein
MKPRKRATTYRHKRYDARSSLPIPSIQLAPCSAEIAQLAPGQLSYASKRIETEARPSRNNFKRTGLSKPPQAPITPPSTCRKGSVFCSKNASRSYRRAMEQATFPLVMGMDGGSVILRHGLKKSTTTTTTTTTKTFFSLVPDPDPDPDPEQMYPSRGTGGRRN